ncbi:MAG TPA: tRNA dimethylallyltransferase, partial [Opitutus sp.]|nr:tRNA dimethylallyltransferase [Opitutus sp.]
DRAPRELEERIRARVATMLRDGLVAEVRALLKAGLQENLTAARAIGYREVIDFLEGRLAENELAGEIAKNTRRLVKKQRTWFRTQLPEHRVIEAATLRVAADLFPE